jgi:acetyl esterase/lipase
VVAVAQQVPVAPLRIWPGVAPGSESWSHDEEALTDPDSGIFLIRNVVTPTLTPVLPAAGTANGSAVVVAPGGGFAALAWHHEGTSTAKWFADRGVTAFVLKYRLAPVPVDPVELAATLTERLGPMPDDPVARGAWFLQAIGNAWELAAADGEQAVRTVRAQAASWGLDASRVGIIGYSAGGTVAVQAAATADPEARPAFVANIYGAFLRRDVTADAPPYFGVVAADDALCLDFCLDAARRWREAGVPPELHVYERGGHGFGMTPQGLPVDTWVDRLAEWLATHSFL